MLTSDVPTGTPRACVARSAAVGVSKRTTIADWPSHVFLLKHRQISLRQIWNQTGKFSTNFSAPHPALRSAAGPYGDTQMSALADMIQSALMLRYNQRKVG